MAVKCNINLQRKYIYSTEKLSSLRQSSKLLRPVFFETKLNPTTTKKNRFLCTLVSLQDSGQRKKGNKIHSANRQALINSSNLRREKVENATRNGWVCRQALGRQCAPAYCDGGKWKCLLNLVLPKQFQIRRFEFQVGGRKAN